MSLKNPVTQPGIDPGTIRLVTQHLNHYATPGPYPNVYLYRNHHTCPVHIIVMLSNVITINDYCFILHLGTNMLIKVTLAVISYPFLLIHIFILRYSVSFNSL
jgi:hypothetical protein